MPSSLFRSAALESRRDSWLGEAQIIQPLPIKVASLVCVLLVSALVMFLGLGAYTRRVHAQGILAPKTGLITVASPSAGRVGTTGAHEGATVEKGQLLFTIDVDAVSASGKTQEQVLKQLRAQQASVEHQRLIKSSVATIQKQALQDELTNTLSRADGTRKQVTLQTQLAQSLRDRAEQLRQSLAQGLALADQFNTQNYFYLQAQAQLANFEQSTLQLTGKAADLKAKLAEFDSLLARDLAELDQKIATLRQQIAESEAKHAVEVRAPENGILTSLRVHAGQQVPAGGTLLTLLPNVGNLRADLYVESSAIGFVERGEPVMLRYAAFPFQRFGLHRGEVTEVTRAPIDANSEPEKSANSHATAASGGLYRVTVTPDQGFVTAYGEKRRLEAGMQVEADVAIEKRSLYKWLLDPVRHLKRSADLVTAGATPAGSP